MATFLNFAVTLFRMRNPHAESLDQINSEATHGAIRDCTIEGQYREIKMATHEQREPHSAVGSYLRYFHGFPGADAPRGE